MPSLTLTPLPLITDPAFYAVAVPAALLVGLGKSGVAGGFGILAVPLIALAMPVPQAAAIVLPLLTVGDLFGLAALIRHRDRALLRVLLPAGLAGTVVGFLLFGVLAPKTVSAVLGVMTLLFVAQRAWSSLRRGCARGAALVHRARRAWCRASRVSSPTPAGRRSRSRCCRCGSHPRCSRAPPRCSSR